MTLQLIPSPKPSVFQVITRYNGDSWLFYGDSSLFYAFLE